MVRYAEFTESPSAKIVGGSFQDRQQKYVRHKWNCFNYDNIWYNYNMINKFLSIIMLLYHYNNHIFKNNK